MYPKISAIIVALNEEILVGKIISELKKQQYKGETEIILADGGSTDETIVKAKQEHIIIVSSDRGKAFQMNQASRVATGDVLFFVHADMSLDAQTFSTIQAYLEQGFDGGGFANRFDEKNEEIKALGTWMNFRLLDKREQSDKGVFYGDNGIFVRREVFDSLNGFKEIAIMEDYDFSVRLRQQFRSIKIQEPAILISSRRHLKAGMVKTRLQWIIIRKLYKWGVNPNLLARLYKDVR